MWTYVQPDGSLWVDFSERSWQPETMQEILSNSLLRLQKHACIQNQSLLKNGLDDIFVSVLLGPPHTVGYKFAQKQTILGDNQMVGLITKKENAMDELVETLKNMIKTGDTQKLFSAGANRALQSVGEELEALGKIYDDAWAKVDKEYDKELEYLVFRMESFLQCLKKRRELDLKRTALINKIPKKQDSKDIGNEEDEEGDDE